MDTENNDASLKLKNQLCHRLYVVSNAITRAYRPFLLHLNLTYPQYIVMMGLWEKDHVEVSQLQQQTLIDSGALTLILKKLQEKGLLQLLPCTADKRKKHIVLTHKGQQLKQQALQYLEQRDCHVQRIKPEEIEALNAMLDTLKQALLVE